MTVNTKRKCGNNMKIGVALELWSSVVVAQALALVSSTHREHRIAYPATRERETPGMMFPLGREEERRGESFSNFTAGAVQKESNDTTSQVSGYQLGT